MDGNSHDTNQRFFDALKGWLHSVAVVPLASPVMAWRNIQPVTGITWTCGFCDGTTSNDKGWFNNEKGWKIRVCAGCEKPSLFDESDAAWPKPTPGRSVQHVPKDTNKLFEEARLATQAGSYTAAVMACRKVLSHIAVEKGAKENQTFKAYIEYLADKGYVTPDGRAWVDYIKDRGNDANHEILLMAEKDAKGVLHLTENLLRNVYELPMLVPT